MFNVGNFGLATLAAAGVYVDRPEQRDVLGGRPAARGRPGRPDLLAAATSRSSCPRSRCAAAARCARSRRSSGSATCRSTRSRCSASCSGASTCRWVHGSSRCSWRRSSSPARRSRATSSCARSTRATLSTLVRALEAKDSYTAGHVERVAKFAEYMGRGLQMKPADLERLRYVALMHDIGKLIVPEPDPQQAGQAHRGGVRAHAPPRARLGRAPPPDRLPRPGRPQPRGRGAEGQRRRTRTPRSRPGS